MNKQTKKYETTDAEIVLHSPQCKETESDLNTMQTLLIKCPQFINNPCNLRNAVILRHVKCVKFLLENGANVDAITNKNTPLAELINTEDINDKINNLAALLLKFGANPNVVFSNSSSLPGMVPYINPLIIYPLLTNNVTLMQLLLEHGADPNVRLYSHLIHTQSLLRCSNVDILTCAIEDAYYQITELLLKHGAEVNNSWNTFVTWTKAAISNGNLQLTKILLIYQVVTPKTEIQSNVSICAIMHDVSSHPLQVSLCKILYEFGFDFEYYYNNFLKNSRTTELSNIMKSYGTQPRSLKSTCRLAIFKKMGRKYIDIIDTLEIPLTLNQYLKFGDV